MSDCWRCNGRKVLPCPVCDRVGTVTCRECRGRQGKWILCGYPNCNEGKIPSYSGEPKDCPQCHGSQGDGKGHIWEECRECKGKGYVDCDDCGSFWSGVEPGWIKCHICNGTGKTDD